MSIIRMILTGVIAVAIALPLSYALGTTGICSVLLGFAVGSAVYNLSRVFGA